MECVEAALKTSFRKETCLKSLHQQAFLDDLFPVNVLNLQNGVSAEDFSVDELLDFSNQEEFEEDDEEEDGGEKVPQENNEKNINLATAKDDFGPLPAGELAVPVPTDDLASLEWLSHFVEDSNSEYATPFPAGILLSKGERLNRTEAEKKEPVSLETLFKTPVPAKARSKRTRAEMRGWPLGTPSSESSCSTNSSTSSSSAFQATQCWLTYPAEPGKRLKPMKRKNKVNRTVVEESDVGGGGGPPKLVGGRRCSHCGVQKTPQWRTGPLGAKTLCNACGVRFKSGRLMPEYRPACSPTFSSELHSNSHRKVLEMRRKKEILGVQLEKTGLNPNPNPNPISIGDGIPSF